MQGPKRTELLVKMRKSMPFGQLLAWLKARFEKTEHYRLCHKTFPSYCAFEWTIIFESDTPAHVAPFLSRAASLRTKNLCVQLDTLDRSTLRFVAPDDVEAVDMTTL
jgi:hypothetical protein